MFEVHKCSEPASDLNKYIGTLLYSWKVKWIRIYCQMLVKIVKLDGLYGCILLVDLFLSSSLELGRHLLLHNSSSSLWSSDSNKLVTDGNRLLINRLVSVGKIVVTIFIRGDISARDNISYLIYAEQRSNLRARLKDNILEVI